MKKILLTLACVLGMSMAASAYSTTAVLLVHDGQATTFEAEQINDAMEAAEDGDVIYLNEGEYPKFNIHKKISVKGVGQLTVIKGDIDIAITDTLADYPTLTEPLLEYLNITGQVSVSKDIKGFRIKQCRMAGMVFKAKTYDSYIDRCVISRYYLYGDLYGLQIGRYYSETITVDGVSHTYNSPYIKGLTVTNSYIYALNGNAYCTNANFINCYIESLQGCGSTIINSIVRYYASENSMTASISNTHFISTYYCTDWYYEHYGNHMYEASNGIDFTNCEFTSSYPFKNSEYIVYDVEKYLENRLIGNDGTVVGPAGGNTPYTLEPAVPRVTESTLKVDQEQKQLNVKLTVSPQ